MLNESELNNEILKCDNEIEIARKNISSIKKILINAESDLISAKLRKDNYVDQVRILKARNIIQPLTLREIEIEKFKIALPDLLKKI